MSKSNNNYITLYPSYWLYNAGLVGIIRTIETAKGENENNDPNIDKMKEILNKNPVDKHYYFGKNGELFIHKEVWKILPDLYVWMMSWMFNEEHLFWWDKFFQKVPRPRLMANLVPPGKISEEIVKSPLFRPVCEIDKLLYIYKITRLKNFLLLIDEQKELQKEIKQIIIKNISLILSDIKNNKKETDVLNEIKYNRKKKELEHKLKKQKIKNIINFQSLKININKLQQEFKNFNVNKYLKSLFKRLLPIGNSQIKSKLFFIDKNPFNNKILCSICNNNYESSFYDVCLFLFEGGSTGEFSNFYWGDNSQVGICKECKFVLVFYPISLFYNQNLTNGEFINISNVEHLWTLNQYLYNLKEIKINNLHTRLIDAITSTGVILKIKSRWMLQNVEFIEIGGIREKTVYNLDISPIPLTLLTDYSYGLIPVWLSDVERIYIKHKEYPEIKGRNIIKLFLKNEIGEILNNSICLFKYRIKEGKTLPLKNLLLLVLSLIRKKQASDEFYVEGMDLERNITDRKTKELFIERTFRKIINNQKSEFVEDIIRLSMQNKIKISDKISKFLQMEDLEFKSEALLFLTGFLEGG